MCSFCIAGTEYVDTENDCTTCDTGKYQISHNTSKVTCKFCLAGKYIDTKITVCKSCNTGQYSSSNDAAVLSCKNCVAGKQFNGRSNFQYASGFAGGHSR